MSLREGDDNVSDKHVILQTVASEIGDVNRWELRNTRLYA